MTAIAQSKSLLAKLLATENITIRQDASAKTASFDVKNRVLTLPVWLGISESLKDMLIVHEVGHALDTPCDGWLDAMKRIAQDVHGADNNRYVMAVKGFLNVVEDARIDRRQKLRYPGSRHNYLAGYKELIDRDFFGLKNRDPNTLSFIDRANLYFKGGSLNMSLEFSPEERRLLSRMDSTETFDDVIKLTEELYRLAASRKDEQQELESDDFTMSEDGEGEEVEFDYEESDEEGDDDFDGRGSSADDSEDDDAEDGDEDQNNRGGGKTDEDFVPKSETDEAFEKARENLADGSIKYVYVSMPKPDLKEIVLDYKTFLKDHERFYANSVIGWGYEPGWLSTVAVELAKIRNEENNTISYMVKEFEQRKAADIYARQSIAKTGVIDTNKLHSYRYNDDIFRRLSIVPNGKNHGFVMFLDWSGSMSTNLKYTVRQLMSLTMFCKRVQIPFEVYLFRDSVPTAERFVRDDHTSEGFLNFSNDFVLRNVLSSRMNANELNRAYLYLWAAAIRIPTCERMHGTPLNEAIYVADEIVNNFRIKNKLQVVNTIFLTDGDSNWSRFKDNTKYQYPTVDGKRIKKVYVYQDPKTKKEYTLSGGFDNRDITTMLLKVLKDRTNSNLVGFYLFETPNFHNVQRKFFGMAEQNEYMKNNSKLWSEKFFVPVTTSGYDEYYIINPKSFRQSAVPEVLNVDSSMTKAKVAKEFLKFSEKKAINRLLLSRFMERVAGKINNAA